MTYAEKLLDPRWQKKRLEIFKRDDFTCQCCKAADITLNVHHLEYHSDPWDVPDEMLITLCADCHNAAEKTLKEIRKLLPANMGAFSRFCRCLSDDPQKRISVVTQEMFYGSPVSEALATICKALSERFDMGFEEGAKESKKNHDTK